MDKWARFQEETRKGGSLAWLSKTRANKTSSQQNQWISKLNLANYRDADHHTKMAPKLLCRDGGHSKLPGQNQNEGRRNLATRQEGGGGVGGQCSQQLTDVTDTAEAVQVDQRLGCVPAEL